MKTQLRWAGHVWPAPTKDHVIRRTVDGYRNRDAPLGSAAKIRLRRHSTPAALIRSNGLLRLPTEMLGALPSTKLPAHLKLTAVPPCRKLKPTKAEKPCSCPTPDLTFPWSRCGRTCWSRIGLISHQPACTRTGQNWLDLIHSSTMKWKPTTTPPPPPPIPQASPIWMSFACSWRHLCLIFPPITARGC